MTTRQITISWHFLTFAIGVIFGAGVLYASVSNLKAQTYSHEDGKILELKVENLSQIVQQQSAKLDAIQAYLQTGKWEASKTH